jgi:hypothetical protein
MKILVRNENQKQWKMVKSFAYVNEAELQKLLSESPELIPSEDLRDGSKDLVAVVREFSVSIGSIDLLAFSEDGDIAIIECKLADNPEVKRKVIGQVLEYGAAIWGMDYEELDQIVKVQTGTNLADLVHNKIDNPEWDEELFRSNIGENLKEGNFILVIVVDEINDDLTKIIRFLNACGNPKFSFAALEMRRFHTEDTEILVPRVDGDLRQPLSRKSHSRKNWDKESILEDAQKKLDKSSFDILVDLYEFCELYTHEGVGLGSGIENGSFTFYYLRKDVRASIFSVYSHGVLQINFGYMSKIFTNAEIDDFKNNLSKITSLSGVLNSEKYYYMIKIKHAFEKQAYLEEFKQIIFDIEKLL